jgi:hypothetical protein
MATLDQEARRETEPEMTTLSQTQRRIPASMIARATLAVALLAGVGGIGGLVGARVQATAYDAANAKAAQDAKWGAYGADWERRYRAQQGQQLTPRDEAVLKAAQEWEVRYRAMYPG